MVVIALTKHRPWRADKTMAFVYHWRRRLGMLKIWRVVHRAAFFAASFIFLESTSFMLPERKPSRSRVT